MGIEFELKYRAEEAVLEAIARRFGGFHPISMETAYYDTPDGALARRKWTLRRRLENGRSLCTLKTPGENGARGEWETECDHISSAIPVLCKLGCPEELAALTASGLIQTCAARFTRLAALIQAQGCTLELALDRGFLLGGGQELPFAEAEVELKEGSQDAAVRFAQSLAAEFGLTEEPRSKFARARALAEK